MTDGEILRQQLDKNLTDFDLRLVYSDWLESNNMLHEAQVQRWIAEHRVIPWNTGSFDFRRYGNGYDWMYPDPTPSIMPESSVIPDKVYERVLPLSRNAKLHFRSQAEMPKIADKTAHCWANYAEFPTQLEAYAALELVLLGMLHEGVELDYWDSQLGN